MGPESELGEPLLHFPSWPANAARGVSCAWIDVSNTLSPESCCCSRRRSARLSMGALWLFHIQARRRGRRHICGFLKNISSQQWLIKGLHGGGFGPHPCGEVKGLARAVSDFLILKRLAPRCAEPQPGQRTIASKLRPFVATSQLPTWQKTRRASAKTVGGYKPWTRIEQALRVADLLLQAGGFCRHRARHGRHCT